MSGKDAGYARNHGKIGLTVCESLDGGSLDWDTLIVAKKDDFSPQKIESALKAGKEVVCFSEKSEARKSNRQHESRRWYR